MKLNFRIGGSSGGNFRRTQDNSKKLDIIANDYHGVVLLNHSLECNVKLIEYRTIHRYKIPSGKLVLPEKIPAYRQRVIHLGRYVEAAAFTETGRTVAGEFIARNNQRGTAGIGAAPLATVDIE